MRAGTRNSSTRIGIMSELPPTPVSPTSTPTMSPPTIMCQSKTRLPPAQIIEHQAYNIFSMWNRDFGLAAGVAGGTVGPQREQASRLRKKLGLPNVHKPYRL